MTNWLAALDRAYERHLITGGYRGYTGYHSDFDKVSKNIAPPAGVTARADGEVTTVTRRLDVTEVTSRPDAVVTHVIRPNPKQDQAVTGIVTRVTAVTADLDEWFEERAAFIEEGSGVRRDWAESFARLDLVVPPPGFQPDRWRQLVDDGGRFLDRWATRAASLGWSTEEVFGIGLADALQQQGLVAFLRGGEVADLDADHAVLRSTMGSCLLLLRCARGGRAMWDVAQE